MSDELAEQRAAEETPRMTSEPSGRSVTLSATLHTNGQVEFTIPKNKIVAHGLAGMVQAELAKMETMQKIVPLLEAQKSHGGINGLLKRMNGG